MKNFVNAEKIVQNYFLQVVCHNFSCIAAVKLLQFLTFIIIHCTFNKTTQIPLNRYEKVNTFMEFFVNAEKIVQNYFPQVVCHNFSCIAAFKLLQFLTFNSKHCVSNKFFLKYLL